MAKIGLHRKGCNAFPLAQIFHVGYGTVAVAEVVAVDVPYDLSAVIVDKVVLQQQESAAQQHSHDQNQRNEDCLLFSSSVVAAVSFYLQRQSFQGVMASS